MNNSFLTKTKKGAISPVIADFWAYVAFVFVVLIFYLFFTSQSKVVGGNQIISFDNTELNDKIKAESFIIAYLMTPITFNIDNKEEHTTLAEFITMYYSEQNTPKAGEFQKILTAKTNSILNKAYKNLEWKIIFSDKKFGDDFAKDAAGGQTDLEPSKEQKEQTLVDGLSSACILLPNPNLKNPIKVEFIFFNFNAQSSVREKHQSLKPSKFHC